MKRTRRLYVQQGKDQEALRRDQGRRTKNATHDVTIARAARASAIRADMMRKSCRKHHEPASCRLSNTCNASVRAMLGVTNHRSAPWREHSPQKNPRAVGNCCPLQYE